MQSIRIQSNAEFKNSLIKLKEKLPDKEGLLCPNKIITTVKEVIGQPESLKMPEIILKVLDDTLEYCAAKFAKDKRFPDDIQNAILSRLYTYAIKDTKNYSWHVFTSEVHDTDQAHLNDVHTSHELVVSSGASLKDSSGVTKFSDDHDVLLHFYTKRICQFKVNGQQKRLTVVIINQIFEPSSTFEHITSHGLKGMFDFSWESAFSIKTLSFVAFIAMVGIMMLGNTLCKDLINVDPMAPKLIAVPDGVHLYEAVEGEVIEAVVEPTTEEDEAPVRDATWREVVCRNQQSALG